MLENLQTNTKCLILTHKRPDGDAISSSLAMYTYFIDKGVAPENIEVYIPEMSDSLKFIDKNNITTKRISDSKKDLVIIVDVSSKDRIEGIDYLKDDFKNCIIIDHHRKYDDFLATENAIIDTNSDSCTCMINNMFADKIKNEQNMADFAEYVIIGILSDIGEVINAKEDSINIVNKYKEKYGINPSELLKKLETMDSRTSELYNICNKRIKIKDGVIYTYLLQDNLKPEEKSLNAINHKAIIQELIDAYIRDSKGKIHSLLLLMQNMDGTYKGSTRTTLKGINLNEECDKLKKRGIILKGGGHPDRAGITIQENGDIEKTAEGIIDEMFIRKFKLKRGNFISNIRDFQLTKELKNESGIDRSLVNQIGKAKKAKMLER